MEKGRPKAAFSRMESYLHPTSSLQSSELTRLILPRSLRLQSHLHGRERR